VEINQKACTYNSFLERGKKNKIICLGVCYNDCHTTKLQMANVGYKKLGRTDGTRLFVQKD
jgi:hypothetical protein